MKEVKFINNMPLCDTTARESIEKVSMNVSKNAEEVSKLSEDKVDLPKDADGKPLNGTVGQFATSDGNGGIAWVTVQNGSEVAW